MSQYNNPYTNPQIQGVDFGVIAEAGQQAANNIAEASQSLIKQKAEAYEELQNSYADFTDKTTLERLKGLDEQQNNAIRASAKVSIEDFSRMSQSKKQEVLSKVADIKAARAGLEEMMKIANDPNHVITKGLDEKEYKFLKHLGQAENLEFMPEKEGLGFILKDTSTGDEYSYSDINNMLPMYQDVGETLKGAGLVYDDEASKIYEARKEFKEANNQNYPNEKEAYLKAGKNIYDKMNAKENKILYENEVSPHDKWQGTELQKKALIEYNAGQVEQRQQPLPDMKIDTRRGSTASMSQVRQAETDETYFMQANNFKADYLAASNQKNVEYLEGYLPVGYFMDATRDGFDIYKAEVVTTEGVFLEEGMSDEKKKKIIKEKEPVRTIPYNNPKFGHRTFTSLSGKTFPFLQSQYMDNPRTEVTKEQESQILSRFKGEVTGQQPLDRSSGVYTSPIPTGVEELTKGLTNSGDDFNIYRRK